MWWMIGYLIALLLHELGHLLVGMTQGLRPAEIHLGMAANGCAVARWRLGATTIVIGWLPLGAGIAWEGMGQPAPPRSRSLQWNNARRRIKLATIAAGPGSNLLLAALLIALPATDTPWRELMVCNLVLGGLQLLPSRSSDADLFWRTLRFRGN